ncbi:methionine gamma-lyase-like [Triticum dicoccoides]|uniref:methionine gamma-lyase-like n=1 Tax=Triticum dicoccoides TaxID=85692 RepID=UPI000E7AD832|nr:methionine gamma-lyase-like [Triticum dicoccoides]
MAHVLATAQPLALLKRPPPPKASFGDGNDKAPKARHGESESDPAVGLAVARPEFGEHGGVNMSIEASATFTVMEPDILRRLFTGELGPERDQLYIYSRHFNPTVLALGRQMAALEGTEAAYCTASGMSAISSVLMQLVGAGGHVVASRCLYGGTHALLSQFLPRTSGVHTTFVDTDDEEAVRSAMKPGETRVVFVETMSNPTLAVADIPMLARLACEAGAKLVVDNTFTPVVVSPARLGADVVVHSMSKFISGGADIIAGAICGPACLVKAMMDLQDGALMLLGPTMNAKVASELAGRLPHLPLRMQEHSRRAAEFATRMRRLRLHVTYPGLPDHPHHDRLSAMGNPGYGAGGMLCVDMGTEERANSLMYHLQNSTRFGLMAVSLGYYQTLMSCSGNSTSSEMAPDDRARAGISPGLIRMSIGYNGTLDQRWAQFERAVTLMKQETTSASASKLI